MAPFFLHLFVKTVHRRGHFVHVITVEGDDAQAHDVRNVRQGGIFGSFQFQYAGERTFRFYPVFDGGDNESRLLLKKSHAFWINPNH